MDATHLIDHLAADGPLLVAAAERAGLDAPVPGTRWDVRTLVTHAGGVHRWATVVVSGGSKERADAARGAVGSGPDDDELLGWFTTGHGRLVAALGDAPADLDAFTFLPAPTPLTFWARRQAHETAIHRADAEAASGPITAFDTDFAQDGIDEMLGGFAARRSNVTTPAATLALRPSDGAAAWLLTFGGERIQVRAGDGDAGAAVTGSSSDLYLWLWNRGSAARVDGDAAIAGLWADTVQVRWG